MSETTNPNTETDPVEVDSPENQHDAYSELEKEPDTDLTGDEKSTSHVETKATNRVAAENGEADNWFIPTKIAGKKLPYLHWRRERKKRKRKAKKGYVQWYLIGETFPAPHFVKPEAEGGGIPEYEYNGETYWFPKSAALASEQQGMWTFIHREGESDPINLRDPSPNAMPSDTVKEWLEMRVTTSPPGLFDKLDLTPEALVKYAIFGLIGYAILQSVAGGGVF